MSLPPLEALEALLVSARLGSFSAAAREMNITHGAISRRISGLESWLGGAIFVRHGRGVHLTTLGQHLSRSVEVLLAELVALRSDLRATRGVSTVRLCVPPAFARLWMMHRLTKLQGTPADLCIRIMPEYRITAIGSGDADLGICYGAGDWPGVNCRPLIRERLFVVATPAVAKLCTTCDPTSVFSLPLLYDTVNHWRQWCKRLGIRYRPDAGESRYDDHDLVLAAAEAGQGPAMARWPIAAHALATGRLVRLAGPVLESRNGYFVVTHIGEQRESVLRLADRLLAEGRRDCDVPGDSFWA
jgi:DNA-binding transcriptional LysR family regulator